jgi:hypothetical protein
MLGELADMLEGGVPLGCAVGEAPHVHLFEGHARWSRVQLQNGPLCALALAWVGNHTTLV